MKKNITIFVIFLTWLAAGIWAAIEGHPAALILFGVYMLFFVLPFGVGGLWKKIKK
jgi:hypothetical protein